jgi:amino acid transporter
MNDIRFVDAAHVRFEDLPGTVAAVLGDRTLIMVFWGLGGLYSLMGAVVVAELAAMIPVTGGFRVYAQRAFGEGIGFAVGWCDWLNNAVSLAYGSITAVAFLGVLWRFALLANVRPAGRSGVER